MTDFVNITTVDIAVDQIDADVCSRIAHKIQTLDIVIKDQNFNLWNHFKDDNDFKQLGSAMVAVGQSLLDRRSNKGIKCELGRGWIVSYDNDSYQTPHHHGRTLMVGIAYIDFDVGAGDLLLQDPLSMFDWVDRFDQLGNCRASVHVTPKAGMLVAMPGYLIHSTQPKPPGKKRVIISTNFND